MKKVMVRGLLLALLLIGGTVPVLADGGGGLPPLCYPNPCPMGLTTAGFDGPGFPPLCLPSTPCP